MPIQMLELTRLPNKGAFRTRGAGSSMSTSQLPSWGMFAITTSD
jgi:hypothetical protein